MSTERTPVARPSITATLLALGRQSWAGLRLMVVFTVVLGLGYPLVVTGIGQGLFPWQANGSQVTADGAHTTDPAQAAGSILIGQNFTGAKWFAGRPSASDYDTLASGATNTGPNDPAAVAEVNTLRQQIARRDGVDPALVPPDAVTSSASGLDPDISPAYAHQQVNRVAKARGLEPAAVDRLVTRLTEGRMAGVLGEERVCVLKLNLAVEKMDK